jgi:hypothetical protein
LSFPCWQRTISWSFTRTLMAAVSDNGGSLFPSLTVDGFEDANGNPIAARWSRRGRVRWELSSRWLYCRLGSTGSERVSAGSVPRRQSDRFGRAETRSVDVRLIDAPTTPLPRV